jgi:hypothetical protein
LAETSELLIRKPFLADFYSEILFGFTRALRWACIPKALAETSELLIGIFSLTNTHLLVDTRKVVF